MSSMSGYDEGRSIFVVTEERVSMVTEVVLQDRRLALKQLSREREITNQPQKSHFGGKNLSNKLWKMSGELK